MELIAAIPVIGGLLSTIIPFLAVLGIVVFIHEYGHYIVGRWCGIHADVFSVGYGKPLKQWTDKRGTVWQIAALPLGGYVKFKGDMNAASFDDGTASSQDPNSFPAASVARRALTVLAGPVFNFILSGFVFAGLLMWSGQATEQPIVGELTVEMGPQHDLRVGDEILSVNAIEVTSFGDIAKVVQETGDSADIALTVRRDGQAIDVLAPYLFTPRVTFVEPLSAASKAGLKPGDLITKVDGTGIDTFYELQALVLEAQDQELILEVRRDGQSLELPVTPLLQERMDADGNVYKKVLIGVMGALGVVTETDPVPFWRAIPKGFEAVWDVIVLQIKGISKMISGAMGLKNINGPVGIAVVSGDMSTQGVIEFIKLVALISTAIGLLNLFPIPILDGGHLVFYAYEAVVGRPPHPRVLNMAMSIGFVLLLALMLFATYNDIQRLL